MIWRWFLTDALVSQTRREESFLCVEKTWLLLMIWVSVHSVRCPEKRILLCFWFQHWLFSLTSSWSVFSSKQTCGYHNVTNYWRIFQKWTFFFAFLSFTQTSLYNTREKNVKYLSSSPHWFHVRKTENYLPSVWEYLYFGLYIFSYCWKDVFGSRCWSVFSKCRYVISSHGNHWDHTELEHICILLLLFIRSKQLKHIWTSDTVALTLGRHLCCLPLVLQGFFFKSDISICVVAAAST